MLKISPQNRTLTVTHHPLYTQYCSDVLSVDYALDESAIARNDTSKHPLGHRNVAIKIGEMSDDEFLTFLAATPYSNYTHQTFTTFLGLSRTLKLRIDGLPKAAKDIPYTKDNRDLADLTLKATRMLLKEGRVALIADTHRANNKVRGYFSVVSGLDVVDWAYGDLPNGGEGLVYVHLISHSSKFSLNEGHYGIARHSEYFFKDGKVALKVTEKRVPTVAKGFTGNLSRPATVKNIDVTVGGKQLEAIPVEIINWDGSQSNEPPKLLLQNIASLSIKMLIIRLWRTVGLYLSLPSTFVFTDEDRNTIRSDVPLTPTVINVLDKDAKVQMLEASGASQNGFKDLEDHIQKDILSAGSKLFGGSEATVGSENSSVFDVKTKTEFSSLSLLQESFGAALERLFPIFLKFGMINPSEKIEVTYQPTFIDAVIDPRLLESMVEANASGLMPVNIFFNVMAKAGWLSEDVTLSEFKEMLNDKTEFVAKMTSTTDQILKLKQDEKNAVRAEKSEVARAEHSRNILAQEAVKQPNDDGKD